MKSLVCYVARELREKIGKMSNAIYNSGKFNCKHSDKMWSNLALNKILDEKLSKINKSITSCCHFLE